MKRIILIFLFCFAFTSLFSQVTLSPLLGISTSVAFSHKIFSNLDVGVHLKFRNTGMNIFGSYSLDVSTFMPFGSNRENTQLLGGGISYLFGTDEKKIRFLLMAEAYTDVASTYRGRFIPSFSDEKANSFDIEYAGWWNGKDPSIGDQIEYLYSNYYVSTPLLINFIPNIQFHFLTKGLSVNLGLGLGVSAMRRGFKSWSYGTKEPTSVVNHLYSLQDEPTHNITVKWSPVFSFRFAIQYIIPNFNTINKNNQINDK